jgi:dolichol kinase
VRTGRAVLGMFRVSFCETMGLSCTGQTMRYTMAVVLSSLLEALSVQNDNLTLPLYMWSVLSAIDV